MSGEHEHHRPYEDLAVRHVMGALDDSEAGAFRSHLLDCGECRSRVGELRAIASDLATVERDERRERAAQRVQTREAEEKVPPTPAPHTPTRTGRVALVVGILLVVVLSSWNFVLRGQNERLLDALQVEAGASATINFGQPWTIQSEAARVEGMARVEGSSLAVMVRGTDDGATYQVSLYATDGTRLSRGAVSSREQQIRYFLDPTPAEAARVDVTLLRGTGETVVFRAVAPDLDAASPAEDAAVTGPSSQ